MIIEKKAIASDKRNVLLSTVFYIWNLYCMKLSSSFDYWIKCPDIVCAFIGWISKKDLDQKLNTFPTFIRKEDKKRDFDCFEIFHHLNTGFGALWFHVLRKSVLAENAVYRPYFLKNFAIDWQGPRYTFVTISYQNFQHGLSSTFRKFLKDFFTIFDNITDLLL